MRQDLYADLYRKEQHHWWHQSKRAIVLGLMLEHTRNENLKLLDVGCGTGGAMEAFSSYAQVYGLDSSKQAVQFCRNRGLTNVRHESIENTSYKPSQFDVVTLLDVLEHTDEERVIPVIYRLVKPGGVLVVTVPAYGWLYSRWDRILGHKRRYTCSELTRSLEASHFSIVRTTYLYAFLLLPVMVIRAIKSLIYTDTSYPSDFSTSKLINNFGRVAASIERFCILRMGVNIPLGLSIFAIARK